MPYCEKCGRAIESGHRLCSYCYEKEKKQRESSGLCFITTACANAKNLPDNCEELETLRRFRDEYMMSFSEGIDMVKEYKKIAPKIVQKINSLENSNKVYEEIFVDDVIPAVKLINLNKNKKALKIYVDMVNRLKGRFNIPQRAY